MRGSYGVKIPWNNGTFTANMVHKPTFMAYELRPLWHTNPDFYAISTVFIGGGGSLQFVENWRNAKVTWQLIRGLATKVRRTWLTSENWVTWGKAILDSLWGHVCGKPQRVTSRAFFLCLTCFGVLGLLSGTPHHKPRHDNLHMCTVQQKPLHVGPCTKMRSPKRQMSRSRSSRCPVETNHVRDWARTQGYCKRGSGGQTPPERSRDN